MSSQQPQGVPQDISQVVEAEPSVVQSADTSSDDEFSDAREAITSPTRSITARLGQQEFHPSPHRTASTVEQSNEAQVSTPRHTSTNDNGGKKRISQLNAYNAGSSPKSTLSNIIIDTMLATSPSTLLRPDDVQEQAGMHRNLRLSTAAYSPSLPKSLIAADGGFGPMEVDPLEPEKDQERREEQTEEGYSEEPIWTPSHSMVLEPDTNGDDDFDDFEAGGEGEGFDDFDEGFDDNQVPLVRSDFSKAISDLSYPLLDFLSEPSAASNLEALLSPHLVSLFPAIKLVDKPRVTIAQSESNAAFLSDRSYSLWQQLLSPPPFQPPNWVRSRIRRLFLVSLGVPVDLDEILPKTKQKKLVLPYDPTSKASADLKIRDGKGTPAFKEPIPKRTRGPLPPPEFDMVEVGMLCQKTGIDLDMMTDGELKTHVQRLELLAETGKAVLQHWVKRKELAVDEKEAFDSVVESLVRHARRVRH